MKNNPSSIALSDIGFRFQQSSGQIKDLFDQISIAAEGAADPAVKKQLKSLARQGKILTLGIKN